MFAILFDEYGNLYDAKWVGFAKTRKGAAGKMRELVTKDCNGDAELIEKYVNDAVNIMFTPKGEDGCYKILEMPGTFIPEDASAQGVTMTYERDFFSVNDDGTVTLHGWLEERDNDMEGFYDDEGPRHTFVYGDWPDTYDDSADMTDWAAPYQQYNYDIHYDNVPVFVNSFYEGEPGTYLPMWQVNENTPAGDYWCYFDEEHDKTRKFKVVCTFTRIGEWEMEVEAESYSEADRIATKRAERYNHGEDDADISEALERLDDLWDWHTELSRVKVCG